MMILKQDRTSWWGWRCMDDDVRFWLVWWAQKQCNALMPWQPVKVVSQARWMAWNPQRKWTELVKAESEWNRRIDVLNELANPTQAFPA